MDELFVIVEPANLVKLLFDKVLDSLNVMIGSVFNLLYTCCRSLVEVAVDVSQLFKESAIKAL